MKTMKKVSLLIYLGWKMMIKENLRKEKRRKKLNLTLKMMTSDLINKKLDILKL
jgi:hypothetical protein